MLSGKISKLSSKKVGVKATSNPVRFFSKDYFIFYFFFYRKKIGIFEQKSIHCVNRHDYLCSSREMEVVGPLPKIDHIFAIIIYGNHEDLISLFYDDALSPSQSYSFGIIWSRSKFVSFLSPEWWMTVSLIPTIKNKQGKTYLLIFLLKKPPKILKKIVPYR